MYLRLTAIQFHASITVTQYFNKAYEINGSDFPITQFWNIKKTAIWISSVRHFSKIAPWRWNNQLFALWYNPSRCCWFWLKILRDVWIRHLCTSHRVLRRRRSITKLWKPYSRIYTGTDPMARQDMTWVTATGTLSHNHRYTPANMAAHTTPKAKSGRHLACPTAAHTVASHVTSMCTPLGISTTRMAPHIKGFQATVLINRCRGRKKIYTHWMGMLVQLGMLPIRFIIPRTDTKWSWRKLR